MSQATEPLPDLASATRVIRPRRGLAAIDLKELWRYRELFVFLSWRDILVRYKQTYLGIAWAVLQPFLMMVVFSLIFGKGKPASVPIPDGIPYAVFSLAALLPWLFFSNALTESSHSLVASSRMISKIYFPRLIIPLSSTLTGVVDFLIGLGLLFGVMLWFDVPFRWELLFLPFFFGVAFMFAVSVGLWLSALNVKYRDVKYVVPFFVKIGLFASPVIWTVAVIPGQWQFWYNLYPMAGVIEGFRWCVLGGDFGPYWPAFLSSFGIIACLFVSGTYYFRSAEKTFADVI